MRYIKWWREEMNRMYQDIQEVYEAYGLERGSEKIRSYELRDLGIETYHASRSFVKICLMVFGIPWALIFFKSLVGFASAMECCGDSAHYLAGVLPAAATRIMTFLPIELFQSVSGSGLLLSAVVFGVFEVIARAHYWNLQHVH